MSTAPAKPLWAQATAFLLFAAGNIGLNFFNSWALKSTDEEGTWAKPSFDFPIFYTMFHQLVSGSVAFLLATCVVKAEGGGPNFAQYWEYKFVILPIALCSALNTGLNNMSLSMVSLFVNQTIKAMQPLPTTFFSWALAGKKYTIWVCLVVTIVVVGNIMALWHQISGSDDGDKTSVVGIVLCILALFSTCIRPVIMMIVMDGQTRPKLSPTTVLTYDSLSAFCMMFIYWIVSPERAGSIGYLSDPNTGKIGFTIIIVGSLVAFVFNLSIYYVRTLPPQPYNPCHTPAPAAPLLTPVTPSRIPAVRAAHLRSDERHWLQPDQNLPAHRHRDPSSSRRPHQLDWHRDRRQLDRCVRLHELRRPHAPAARAAAVANSRKRQGYGGDAIKSAVDAPCRSREKTAAPLASACTMTSRSVFMSAQRSTTYGMVDTYMHGWHGPCVREHCFC